MNYKELLEKFYTEFSFYHLEYIYVASFVEYLLEEEEYNKEEDFQKICEIVYKIEKNKYNVEEKNLRYYDVFGIAEVVVHYYYDLHLAEDFIFDYDSVLEYIKERAED